MTDLSVQISTDGEHSTLTVVGELDLGSVADLRRHAHAELASGRCRALTLDLAGMTFIDSTGLGLLVELKRMAGESRVELDIVHVADGPARVIVIAGLADTLGISADDAPDS